MTPRPSLLPGLACALAALCAGCGASAVPLNTADAARLRHQLASIGSAVSEQNAAVAHADVRRFEADVTKLRSGRQIAVADAGVLLTDARQLDATVTADVHAPAAPDGGTTTTPAQPAAGAAATTPAGPGTAGSAGPGGPPAAGQGPAGQGPAGPPGLAGGHDKQKHGNGHAYGHDKVKAKGNGDGGDGGD